jgi:hypothetical protein
LLQAEKRTATAAKADASENKVFFIKLKIVGYKKSVFRFVLINFSNL